MTNHSYSVLMAMSPWTMADNLHRVAWQKIRRQHTVHFPYKIQFCETLKKDRSTKLKAGSLNYVFCFSPVKNTLQFWAGCLVVSFFLPYYVLQSMKWVTFPHKIVPISIFHEICLQTIFNFSKVNIWSWMISLLLFVRIH